MKAFHLTLSALLLGTLQPVSAETEMKIYTVYRANPVEIAEIAPQMMPSTNELHLVVSGRKLAVKGTAEQHDIIRDLLHEMDAPPKNIQVNVHFTRNGSGSDREAGIRPDGPRVIKNGKVYGSTRSRFQSHSSTVNENVNQMLVAADGQSASLRVGKTVPNIAWLTEYGGRHGYVRDIGIEWKEVGSFLAVESTLVAPGLIHVRLIPELSGRLTSGERHRIQFTHLATEVTVRNGQTIRIGGFNQDKEFSSKFLMGRSGQRSSSITGISLTPRILP